ncbi:MAG TPA: hypothetical protein VM577_07500 [Anaerovoracaceae bacterium]|nr:hypothetical protein [Anaerovoracaceae bacterium]
MTNNGSALSAPGQKKYELLKDQLILFGDTRLYRIRALRDFGDVKAGDLGGYVEAEKNLSHSGTAWVADDARSFGDAQILDAGRLSDAAWAFGNAKLRDRGRVFGNAWIFADTEICDAARIGGNAKIGGKTRIGGNVLISGDTHVFGNVKIGGKVQLSDRLLISDDTQIPGNPSVSRAWLIAGASVTAVGILVCATVRPASALRRLLEHTKI